MQKKPSLSRFCQLVILGGEPDSKLLLDIESCVVTNIVLGITLCRFRVACVVQMPLTDLHCLEQHCLLGRTLFDYAFAVFGEIVGLVEKPVTHMRMGVTSVD